MSDSIKQEEASDLGLSGNFGNNHAFHLFFPLTELSKPGTLNLVR